MYGGNNYVGAKKIKSEKNEEFDLNVFICTIMFRNKLLILCSIRC